MTYKLTEPKTTPGSAIGVIVSRAAKIAHNTQTRFNPDRTANVIKTVHMYVCPLRLTELAKASDFDLAHDVFGILAHYAGKRELRNCFVPRYAR